MDLEKYYDKYWQDVDDSIDHDRLDMIVKHVVPGAQVLEINCGMGILANKVAKKVVQKGLNGNVTVVDLSAVALERTQSRNKDISKLFKADIDTQMLPFESSTFDTIVSNSMIEHTFFPKNTIKEGTRVLKDGGKFIIMVPNVGHWRFRLWLLFGRFPYLENTPTDTLHIRLFTSQSIQELGKQYGLKVKNIEGSSGLWVNAIYPFFFKLSPVKQIYELLTNIYPSLFARYILVVFEK